MYEEFKELNVEMITDAMSFGLKSLVEKKLYSKLDGMLNTENALVLDDNSTLYYVKGLYSGEVGSFCFDDVEFVQTLGNGGIGYINSVDAKYIKENQ